MQFLWLMAVTGGWDVGLMELKYFQFDRSCSDIKDGA